jgi:ABC-2 type transport system ATP-binding protein
MSTATMVRVDGLSKRYGTQTRVDSLSFEVPAGQVVGVLGPNGAGKTTLLKMLVGLIRPTDGSVEVMGCRADSPKYFEALRRVGALIEAPSIYLQLSVRQNLELQEKSLQLAADRHRIAETLELVDLAGRADDRAKTISLGMKQRLGIAVALLARPDLVILDEPANGLDPAGIVEIRLLLRRLAEAGTSVLVSSHQLAETQQACDRLLVMADGKLVAAGTTEDILSGFSNNRFTVRLDPKDLEAAAQCLTRLELMFDIENSLIRVNLPSGWTGRDLNQALAKDGVHAIEVRHEAVSLEEAFLTMTTTNQTLTTDAQRESDQSDESYESRRNSHVAS